MLLIQGSSALIQQLLAADLIDELRLLIYPLVLGRGKRFFGEGTIPAAFKLRQIDRPRRAACSSPATSARARSRPARSPWKRRRRRSWSGEPSLTKSGAAIGALLPRREGSAKRTDGA